MRRELRELGRALLGLLLPPHCHGCGGEGDGLCEPCARLLQRWRPPWCSRCGTPQPPGLQCPVDHRALRGLRVARSAFAYAGTGGALVRRLKLGGEYGAVPRLVAGMAEAAAELRHGPFRHALVVAVPLHRARRRVRGFDQAQWLGRELARRCGWRSCAGVLRRLRATLPQGDPRVTSREGNVAAAFAMARPEAVAGRPVVLVDDVATSFATARACAAVLRAAGARDVALVTACRA